MKWVLVALVAWANAPPLTILQVPVATKDLCEQAAEQIRKDFSAVAAGKAVGRDIDDTRFEGGGTITTCLQISN